MEPYIDPRAKHIPATWMPDILRYITKLAAAGQSTQSQYLRYSQLARLAREAHPHTPQTLAPDQLVAWLGNHDWSRETRRSLRAGLRSWWLWYGRPEMADAVPAVAASTPAPRPAPDDAVQTALATASPRVALMLRVAIETGARRGEISQIHADDLSADALGKTLRLHGKGAKTRIVPISDQLAATIRLAARDSWLFPSREGCGHLTAGYVGKLMSRVLPGDWTAHTLRHRYATRAYAASDDIIAVSRLLGHASVATTQRYVATDAARLREVARMAA